MRNFAGIVFIQFLAMSWFDLAAAELISRSYSIPAGAFREAASDPFAPGADNGPVRPAREVLEEAGVEFGVGAIANYDEAKNSLAVRQTQEQLWLIENWIEGATRDGSHLVYSSFYNVPFEGNPFLEVQNWEGSAGKFLTYVMTGESGDEIDFKQMAGKMAELAEGHKPGEATVVSVFTDPQFQVLFRAIKESGKFAEPSMGSVMARPGQAASVEVEDQHFGIVSHSSWDMSTVESQFRLSEPFLILNDGETAPDRFNLSVWDGSIVAFLKTGEDAAHRLIFCRILLMDPSGKPFNAGGDEREK